MTAARSTTGTAPGKVVDVQRATTAGFARGHLDVEGSACGSSASGSGRDGASGGTRTLRILFQNEFTVARLLEPAAPEGGEGTPAGAAATAAVEAAAGEVLAVVPDLIILQERSSECAEQGRRRVWRRQSLLPLLVAAPAPALPAHIARPPAALRPVRILNNTDGLPVATEEVRYGLRVTVSALPAHPLLTTPEALAVVGPAAFGHPEVAYAPLRLDSSGALEPHPVPRPPPGSA